MQTLQQDRLSRKARLELLDTRSFYPSAFFSFTFEPMIFNVELQILRVQEMFLISGVLRISC